MKKLPFIFIVFVFGLGYWALADDMDQKTDGAFVGQDPQATVDSFAGSSTKSDNDSFAGGDMGKQTDGAFVGDNTIQDPNNFFAGQDYHKQVKSSTDPAFAQDAKPTPSDDFEGQDTKKQTDGSFVGKDLGS